MKAFESACVILLLTALFQVQCQDDCSNIAKIPAYLGKGYDVVFGNPSSGGVDPGFKYDVFTLLYKNGDRTDSPQFLIPDSVTF